MQPLAAAAARRRRDRDLDEVAGTAACDDRARNHGPLGVCAERTALARAVAEGYGPGDLEEIAITASPCGGCRQWLHEFRLDRVTFRNRDGEVVTYTPAELLPETWDLD